jgi:hypothetical protein
VLASRLKHTAGSGVDPMQPRARDALDRLIRLWIVGDRGTALHLLACVGAAVDENGHDARLTGISVSTLDLAQWWFGRFLFVQTAAPPQPRMAWPTSRGLTLALGREPLHGKMVHVRTERVALVLETIAPAAGG